MTLFTYRSTRNPPSCPIDITQNDHAHQHSTHSEEQDPPQDQLSRSHAQQSALGARSHRDGISEAIRLLPPAVRVPIKVEQGTILFWTRCWLDERGASVGFGIECCGGLKGRGVFRGRVDVGLLGWHGQLVQFQLLKHGGHEMERMRFERNLVVDQEDAMVV